VFPERTPKCFCWSVCWLLPMQVTFTFFMHADVSVAVWSECLYFATSLGFMCNEIMKTDDLR
jgi:hypothetical protein